jgi:nitrous oxide reductase accessory protein NosL
MLLLRSLLIFTLFFTVSTYADSDYSQAIKEKKIYPLGKKIYEKKCKHIDIENYTSFKTLQEAIATDKSCKHLQKKYQEALTLYLWEVKRGDITLKSYPKIEVTHKDKCPICGMFLYKYPRWVSMIEYKDGKKFYFDGLKDLFKYYFEHPQNIEEMLTREYYTQESIPLKKAYFVIGSDVYGPMGNELIAFKDKESARNFLLDHRGKKIVTFDEIDKEMVYKLDE